MLPSGVKPRDEELRVVSDSTGLLVAKVECTGEYDFFAPAEFLRPECESQFPAPQKLLEFARSDQID